MSDEDTEPNGRKEQDRERNKIHARESRARKKQRIESLEQRCRMLEARKQEILLQQETSYYIAPAATIEALQGVVGDLVTRLGEQSACMMQLESDNQHLKDYLAQATFHQKAAKSQAALRHKHKRNASDPPNNDSVKPTNGSSNSSSSSRRGSTTNSASSRSGLHSINGSSNRSISSSSSSSSTESSAESISGGTGSSTGARNINERSSGDVAGSIANSAVSNSFGGASLPFGISPRGNFLTLAEVERLQQPFPQHNVPLTSHGNRYDPASYTEMAATLHRSSSSSHKMQGASGGGAAAGWAPASPPGLESQMNGSQVNGFYGLPQHLVTALLASSNYSGNGHISSDAGGPAADAHANGNYNHSAFPSGSNSVLPTWPHGNIDYRSGGFGASTRVNDPTTGVAASGVRTDASVGTRSLHSVTQTMPPADQQASRRADSRQVGVAGTSRGSGASS